MINLRLIVWIHRSTDLRPSTTCPRTPFLHDLASCTHGCVVFPASAVVDVDHVPIRILEANLATHHMSLVPKISTQNRFLSPFPSTAAAEPSFASNANLERGSMINKCRQELLVYINSSCNACGGVYR